MIKIKNISVIFKTLSESPYIFLLLIVYLIMNTGLVTDDFALIVSLEGKGISAGVNQFIERPMHYFVIGSFYQIIQEHSYLYVYLKIIYTCIIFLAVAKFFSLYYRKEVSYLLTFIFLFFPIHDSTVYWFSNYYLAFTVAFYLYAFYLAKKDKLALSVISALFASFVSYGSVPVAFMAATLFLLEKNVKKAVVMIIPNLIYIAYYFYITSILGMGMQKIRSELSLVPLLKQFILQILTFIDSAIGPSFWLKIYYSILDLSLLSIGIGGIVIIYFYRSFDERKEGYNKKIFLSFILITVLSFMMFALTGYYPQLAFNLGNRTTIYGSLLLTYLIVLLPVRKVPATVIFSLLMLSILGISDHWKNWNKHQTGLIENIRTNQQLAHLSNAEPVYVSGNQYSKLGKISHLEFFSESCAVNSIFKFSLGREMHAIAINKRFKYSDGYMIDTKYNEKYAVNDFINVYDSERNNVFKLKREDINNYIASLPPDNRHWVQLIDNKFLKELAVKLMPRLQYAL